MDKEGMSGKIRPFMKESLKNTIWTVKVIGSRPTGTLTKANTSKVWSTVGVGIAGAMGEFSRVVSSMVIGSTVTQVLKWPLQLKKSWHTISGAVKRVVRGLKSRWSDYPTNDTLSEISAVSVKTEKAQEEPSSDKFDPSI
jgi:hypothetical protein